MVKVRPAVPDDAAHMITIRIRGWRHTYVGIVPDSVLDSLDSVDPDHHGRYTLRW